MDGVMKRAPFCLLCCLLLLLGILCPAALAEPTKVACVGDSITYGHAIKNRESASYPAQLQQWLDKAAPGEWVVKNFGVPGSTLMKDTNKPYVGRGEYRASVDYAADVVIIMLGTNDSKEMHQALIADHFEQDYHALIASYRKGRQEVTPRIILMLPPKCYMERSWVTESVIRETIVPLIRKIASEENLELIDLYAALGVEWDKSLMPDKLHPSAEGAALMVKNIAPVVFGSGK